MVLTLLQMLSLIKMSKFFMNMLCQKTGIKVAETHFYVGGHVPLLNKVTMTTLAQHIVFLYQSACREP